MASRVTRHGFLRKRSDFIKSWNRRYVILTPDALEWYKSGEDEGRGDGGGLAEGAAPPRGLTFVRAVRLQDVVSISKADSLRQTFTLEIRTSDRTCSDVSRCKGGSDRV